ncbi:MAG: S-layer homology domain-containing protein [Clostridia bacterium]|nr:S-layer homology domain-containing protein [Clostridia bacterium]
MKRFLSLIFALIMTASCVTAISAASSGFSDVAETRWSASAIKHTVDRGYMNGVGNGKFDPAGPLTRAMVATVLWRREDSPAPTDPSGFVDVPAGAWYADAVAWAKQTGVVNGMTATTFAPNAYITREQLATMLFRFSSTAPVSVPERADLTPFSDDEKTSAWAEESLEWAVEAGLINGTDGNRLAPGEGATREQFAAIIERYDKSFKLAYNTAVLRSHYTEREYPLVTDADIYVSPDGDDGAAGDFDHPIATFARAVEMARGLKSRVTGRSVVVAFRAGEYHEGNVTMTAEDSGTKEYPVIYCGYGDGEAVITGGTIISEDRFEPIDEGERTLFAAAAADKIKKADIGTVLPGYSDGDVLFGEEGIMWIARFPDKYPDSTDYLMKGAGSTVSDHEIRISMPIMKRRILNVYHTLEGLKLYGYLTLGWYKDTLDVGGYTVDEETGDLDLIIADVSQARYGHLRFGQFPWEEYHASALLNMSEDLDAEGEYWVDEDTRTMYVYDPHGTYTFPVVDRGIVMDSCDYVTFRGLTLKAYRGQILDAEGVVGLTLDRCRFEDCSADPAVTVNGRRGADFDSAITSCEFSVFTGHAVQVDGGCDTGDPLTGSGNFLFDNNRVTYANLTEWGSAVDVSGCNAAVLSHNEFENCNHSAIGSGGHDNVNNVIEYNVFKNVMRDNQDCGAFSFGNSQGDWGNKIRYNLFYPTESGLYDRYAIYLDDNEPAAEIYGNLFFDTAVVIHDGRSNDIHDNIMIDSNVMLSVGGVSGSLERFSETGDPETILGDGRANAFYTRWTDFLGVLDSDPALKEQYFGSFPELSSLSLDVTRANEPSFVLYPRNYVRDNAYILRSPQDVNARDDYSIIENNVCFSFSENPLFVNPTRGDYRIRDGAGFPDIRFEMIGRY